MPRIGADRAGPSPLVPGQLEVFPLRPRTWAPAPLRRALSLPRSYPRPRWETPLPATAVATFGPAVAAHAAAELGLRLDRWQRYVLSRALAVDANRTFVHTAYLASAARQNGKSALTSALISWALTESPHELAWGRIASLAGDRAQARIIYGAVRAQAERPNMAARFLRVTAHAGIEARGGAVYDVLSRDAPRTARGLSLDLAVLDELLVQTSMELWSAVEPTLSARPFPLAFGISTAGDARSILLRAWFDRGLSIIAGAPAEGFGMSWWAAEDPEPTPANIRAANPATADGRLSPARILRSRHSLTPVAFAREHLNLWSDVVEEWLPAGLWREAAGPQPDRPGARVRLGIEAPATWARATITVALAGSDGRTWVGVAAELGGQPGQTLAPAQLVAELAAQVDAWRPDAVAYSKAWAGAPHVEAWAAEHDVTTDPLDGRGLRRASELFRSELIGGRLTHADDDLLALQSTVARPRGTPGDGDWYLSTRDSAGDIDAIRAAVWAAGSLLAPEDAPGVLLYVPGGR
jgi:hypothetical protein